MNTHHKITLFKCSLCGRYDSVLKMHIEWHTGENPFIFEVCNKTFACKSNLREHQNTHFDMRRHNCLQCAKTFLRKSDLTRHVQAHKRLKSLLMPSVQKIVCQCGLRNHVSGVDGHKEHKFDLCGKLFATRNRLAHAEEKPYQCSKCLSAFARKSDLGKYMKTHY